MFSLRVRTIQDLRYEHFNPQNSPGGSSGQRSKLAKAQKTLTERNTHTHTLLLSDMRSVLWASENAMMVLRTLRVALQDCEGLEKTVKKCQRFFRRPGHEFKSAHKRVSKAIQGIGSALAWTIFKSTTFGSSMDSMANALRPKHTVKWLQLDLMLSSMGRMREFQDIIT